MEVNPIAVLDLVSFILSLVVFHFAHEIQKSLGGLFKSIFVIFYSVAVLSLAMVILEMAGFIAPEPSPSNIALHIFMFAVLLLIILGMDKLRHEMPLKQMMAK